MKLFYSRLMNPICEQAGCSTERASKHAWKWETKRWHSHPSIAFTNWWTPTEFDLASGAHLGGHPDAYRQWARKDSDGWKRRWYGVSCVDAWNTPQYVEEFDAWESAGSPEGEPFISVSATLERQKQFWRDLLPTINEIGKPMSEVDEGAVALEAESTPIMPDP